MSESARKVRTPLFPLYSEVRLLMGIWEGVGRQAINAMTRAIWEKTGTPQKPVDWSDPDTWIKKRFSGEVAELAGRIWLESGRRVNPRHAYGSYLFINSYALLTINVFGVYQLSSRGKAFLAEDRKILREIDEAEGLPELLGILADKKKARRGDLLPEWGDFLLENSSFQTTASIKDTLRRRLVNLIERGYLTRDGINYALTDIGRDYAARHGSRGLSPKRQAQRSIEAFNAAQLKILRENLAALHPARFELLIRDLLEAMGYENIRLILDSGVKGIDLLATAQFGISTVTELIQAKRLKGSIDHPVLDQLREMLPACGAARGTLITLSRFTSGCKEAAIFPGASPVRLIDGEQLLALLAEHGIGIKKQRLSLYNIDEDYFSDSTVVPDPDADQRPQD